MLNSPQPSEALCDDGATRTNTRCGSLPIVDPQAVPDLTNAREVPAHLTLTNTMLCMACAGDKVETDVELPLYDLYNGPTWSSLRKALGADGSYRARIVVLSGKYGIVTAHTHSRSYEARLSKEKADELIRKGILSVQDQFGALDYRKGFHAPSPLSYMQAPFNKRVPSEIYPWTGVIICGGSDYRRTFMAFVAQLKVYGEVDKQATVLATAGGIGEQRGQIGRWAAQLVENSRVVQNDQK